MSLLERDVALTSVTDTGEEVIDLPITRVNNVEGFGRCKNTTYSVGDVVYADTNKAIALCCTTGGVTSSEEIDFSGVVVGGTVEDGGVVWLAIARGYTIATQAEAEAGTDNTKAMTPLRTKNAIDKQRPIDYTPSISQRNGYCRRKNLGTIASVADADAFNTTHGLSAGTFDDVFVGDEITIKDGTYNAAWLVAGVDWDYNKGDTESGHGILLIPKTPLYNAQMNSTNVTTGGYKGSAMHATTLPALVTKLQTVLGSHLKKRRVIVSNSVGTSLASMAGAGWTGASNGWEWVDTYAVLPSEVEVYGSTVFGSSFYDVGEANQRLPIFNFINPVYFSHWNFWLRAVASSTDFCLVGGGGYAGYVGASYSGGVRPLIYLG